ncbi:YrdB family protein [Streptomyces sp. NRRL B-3648]|uniref:YrdB family protein n=1 Tax=Streptomyces sp. NRRL B-3648 TaxID=1519493 RepID=UPI00099B8A99|nr:YrdB family protein [Streptomyces sp. NRRL B-3648]
MTAATASAPGAPPTDTPSTAARSPADPRRNRRATGFATGGSAGPSVLLGLGTPLAAGVPWWLFAAPQARLRPALPGVLFVKGLVPVGSAVALYGLGHPVGALVVTVVTAVNITVAEVFRRPVPGRSEPAPGAAGR